MVKWMVRMWLHWLAIEARNCCLTRSCHWEALHKYLTEFASYRSMGLSNERYFPNYFFWQNLAWNVGNILLIWDWWREMQDKLLYKCSLHHIEYNLAYIIYILKLFCPIQIKPLSLEIYFSKHRPSGPMLSISRFVRLSVCPSVRPSVCLFTFEVPFNGLFAPTSRSRMSNIFWDSESLGKSSGKKWSQIWTFLFENCLKSPRKKSFFLSLFSLLRYRLTVFLLPLPEVWCLIFSEIRNPWGEEMERSGLIFEHFCLKIFHNRRAKKSVFTHFFHFWGTV